MSGLRRLVLFGLGGLILVALAAVLWRQPPIITGMEQPQPSRLSGKPTFTRDIAPILYENCVTCHRPGQAAPFSLLTYDQARKHARQIAEVTRSRFMPPWLPEPGGYGEFAGKRRLSRQAIERIQQWVEQGAVEGDPADMPPRPDWPRDWKLGQPDLVVQMPEPYTLKPAGRDEYRNFVVPVPISAGRFVQTVEFRPDNPRIVHHAVILVDRTDASRQRDEEDPSPGYGGGMATREARIPDGHFLGWTPGKMPFAGREGMAWRLNPGDDLVLQLHLRPSGKPESIRAKIGLHFADQPPRYHPYALVLRNKSIDIPPGASEHHVEAQYTLPVDVRVLSVYPHAHYLGKTMKAFASLPNGDRRWLIRIHEWDFNWQDQYRYREPISLPAGSTVSFQYTYDNSTDNIQNPHHPPQRVVYGRQSTDEMAELMLQVLTRGRAELTRLKQDLTIHTLQSEIARFEEKIRNNPEKIEHYHHLAYLHLQLGQQDDAVNRLHQALEVDSSSAKTHYLLGDLLAQSGRFDEALSRFSSAVDLVPEEPHYLDALARLLVTHPRPESRRPPQAVELAERAVELTAYKNPVMMDTLALAYAKAGQPRRAVEAAEKALQTARDSDNEALARLLEGRLDTYRQSVPQPTSSPKRHN